MDRRARYWLTFSVGSFKIRAETTRDHYRAMHAATFPASHGPDLDPPDDSHWWSNRPLCGPICGRRSDDKWAVLHPAIRQSVGGYIEEAWP